MYGGRYGIWGVDPYGPNPMDRAISVAQGLGAIQQQGLQNQGLGLANKYAPENQAISLADSLTRAQNLDWQKQRFGDSYSMSKMYGMLPTPLKLQFAIDNPELVSQAVQGTFQNGNYQQVKNTPNYAMSVLQPYLSANQGIGAIQNQQGSQPQQHSGMGSYQPPIPAQQPQGNTGIGNAPDNSGSTDTDNAAPAQNSNTVDSFKGTATDALKKNLTNADQQKRIDAGGRFQSPIDKINERMPLVMKYVGIAGKGELAKDKLLSSFGINSPSYTAYEEMKPLMEAAKGELAPLLGKRSTDAAAKEVSSILDYDSFWSNPDLSMTKWNTAMKTLNEVRGINKKTTAKQINTPDKSLAVENKSAKSAWSADGKSYVDSNGKSYSFDELQKLAKGGK